MKKAKKREVGLRLCAILRYCVRNKAISPEDMEWFADQCFVIADCVGGIELAKQIGDTLR